jgi:hypothetical protein
MISKIDQPLPENERQLIDKRELPKFFSSSSSNKIENIISVGLNSSYRMQKGSASIYISNTMTSIISVLTLIILLYILLPTFFLNMTYMIVSSIIS